MGRPTIALEDRRDIWVNFRVNSSEWARLDYNASSAGVSLSDFVRRCGLDELRIPSRRQADSLAAAALIGLGNNLNQMTRHANAGRGLPVRGSLEDLLARINTELDRLYGAGDQHGGPHL